MPEIQEPDNRKKGYKMRRSIMDYGMGLIIFCIGIFFIIAPGIGFAFDLDKTFRYLLGGLFIIYGIFRAYRGYKKDYFN